MLEFRYVRWTSTLRQESLEPSTQHFRCTLQPFQPSPHTGPRPWLN